MTPIHRSSCMPKAPVVYRTAAAPRMESLGWNPGERAIGVFLQSPCQARAGIRPISGGNRQLSRWVGFYRRHRL